MNFPRGFSLAGGLLALLYVFSPSNALSQEKLKLAHSALESSNAVWYVAQDRGFYKKNGAE